MASHASFGSCSSSVGSDVRRLLARRMSSRLCSCATPAPGNASSSLLASMSLRQWRRRSNTATSRDRMRLWVRIRCCTFGGTHSSATTAKRLFFSPNRVTPGIVPRTAGTVTSLSEPDTKIVVNRVHLANSLGSVSSGLSDKLSSVMLLHKPMPGGSVDSPQLASRSVVSSGSLGRHDGSFSTCAGCSFGSVGGGGMGGSAAMEQEDAAC